MLVKGIGWLLYLRNCDETCDIIKDDNLTDYKFMCFNGKVKCFLLARSAIMMMV